MSQSKRKKIMPLIKTVLLPVLIVGALLFFFTALSNLDKDRGAEGRDQLETSIRRACAACYATEGIYPPTLEYLVDHYGILIDSSSYNVFYEVFSENLMPEITVVEIAKE